MFTDFTPGEKEKMIAKALESIKKDYDMKCQLTKKGIEARYKIVNLLKKYGVKCNVLYYYGNSSWDWDDLQKTEWHMLHGFTIDVDQPREWARIQKAVGKLERHTIIPENAKKVRVYLKPKSEELQADIFFSYMKKISKKDKCKVVTTVHKSKSVICSN